MRPAVLLVLFAPALALAQAPADTLRGVTVTAERVPLDADRVAGAVAVLTADDLERRPISTLADALRLTPGFAVLQADGAGTPAAATVRGFYGGGETEYVLLLVDGRPVNDVETGVVDWELVPLGAVERVEVLRGGASPLWGDAAIGAVVNVVMRAGAAPVRASLSGGSYDTVSGQIAGGATVGGRDVSAYGSVRRYGGFRDHAARSVAVVGGRVALAEGPRGALSASTHHAATDAELPGPVAGPEIAGRRASSSPFYRFDGVEERRHRAALDGALRLAEGVALDGALSAGWRGAGVVRTLPLSPQFGDTKRRRLDGGRLDATLQLTAGALDAPSALGVPARLVVGATGALQTLASSYAEVVVGDADAYLAARPDPGAEPVVRGDGDRRSLAGYVQAEVAPVPALRLVAGARLDGLRDAYAADGEGATAATHTALSPRAGLNVRWLATDRQAGHVFAQVTRSFKAPTLDQLFDQRRIGVPFPPFAVSLSNAALTPQRGTAVEVGLRHRAALGAAVAEAELTAYQIDMEDEIDFSLQDVSYQNLGASRHRGVEAALALAVGDAARVFGTLTVQEATVEAGDATGRRLKAIPGEVFAVGASAARGAWHGSVVARGARGAWLDDANTIPLDGWTAVDASLAVGLPVPGAALTAEAVNLLDAAYSTTGFPDAGGAEAPGGGPLVYLYPAAGRQLRLGLRVGL